MNQPIPLVYHVGGRDRFKHPWNVGYPVLNLCPFPRFPGLASLHIGALVMIIPRNKGSLTIPADVWDRYMATNYYNTS